MPDYLLEVVDNHPKLTNRAALFTCWGLHEDRQYVESLMTTASLSELVIDLRPHCSVNWKRLIELMYYQAQLIVKQQTLKSLTIKYKPGNTRPFICHIQMEPGERLLSIERLSLEHYVFGLDNSEIQCHMNGQHLRSLILVACINPQILLASVQMKLSQLIIRGPMWNRSAWLALPDGWQLESFLCKGHGLQELELESLGISYEIVRPIVQINGATIRKLRFHNFEHAVLLPGSRQPILLFKSIPSHIIHSIWSFCPHLQSLELDLDETDITRHTDASRTLKTFMSLEHLQINTQLSAPAIDPTNPYMAVVRVRNLARAVWSYSLETFRLTTRSVAAQDGMLLGQDGSWLATPKFENLEYDQWDVEIVDEIVAAAEKKLRVWARAVEVPFDPPSDERERLEWEDNLRKKVEVAGAKALKALR